MEKLKQKLTSLFFFFVLLANSQTKITDTIFYNSNWQICEKPFATYVRTGTAVALDSLNIFKGIIKDYRIIDNLLVMEGEYSDNGFRNGLFTFYYNNGKVKYTGKYRNDKLVGNWKWYYENGVEMATIYFPSNNEQDFQFISFSDSLGNKTMENGNGKFKMPLAFFDISSSVDAFVTGSFNQGRRRGIWKVSIPSTSWLPESNITEEYSDDGTFEKGKIHTKYGNEKSDKPLEYIFLNKKFSITENFLFDDFFRINEDLLASNCAINYLKTKKPVEIKLRTTQFDSAFNEVIRVFHKYSGYINYYYKDIDGKIDFRLGANGYPENVKVSGNFTESEKNILTYIMSKFEGISMPALGSVSIEKDHTIFVYSFNIKEFLPSSYDYKNFFDAQLFYSWMPKDEMIKFLNNNKKDVKKIYKMLAPYIR